jgi:hypothetical protein|eukprot:3400630-Prymnesium_polylepis.1
MTRRCARVLAQLMLCCLCPPTTLRAVQKHCAAAQWDEVVGRVFRAFDLDSSGDIDEKEFRDILNVLA